MSALYYFGIIEGALHAHGEAAYSVKVWHAMRMLAAELKVPVIVPKDMPVSEKVAAAIEKGKAVMESTDLPSENKWLDWQLDTLKTMKQNGETNKAIALACEKTETQIANKCFQLGLKKGDKNHED